MRALLRWGMIMLIACAVPASAQAKDPVEDEVEAVYRRIEEASSRRDLRTVLSYLGEECRIMIATEAGQTQRLNKQDYADRMRRGWAMAQSYQLQSTIHEIRHEGPLLIVESEAREEVRQDSGAIIVSMSRESALWKRIDGQLRLMSVYVVPKGVQVAKQP